MIKYVFKELPNIKGMHSADPQVIGEELEKIAAKSEGKLTPVDVVKAASSVRHPLHKHFEWDNAKAASAFRLEQARAVIRSIRVVDDKSKDEVRAFFSITEKSGTSYRTIDAVRSSLELQLAVLKQAERDLDAFQKRYRDLTDVCDFVVQAKDALATRRAKHESRASA